LDSAAQGYIERDAVKRVTERNLWFLGNFSITGASHFRN
jgi:hypothetical protein